MLTNKRNEKTIVQNKQASRQQLIDSFWRTIPPLWYYARSALHRIAYEEFGITSAQFHILKRIFEGKQSVSELSHCMFVSPPNISRAVEELVIRGWAERERDSQDRRNVNLRLSEKGKELLDLIHQKNNQFLSELFAPLNSEEINIIVIAFNQLDKILHQRDSNQ